MKLAYKLNVDECLHRLEIFVFLTNEFGCPSERYKQLFINSFFKIINNDNFSFGKSAYKRLNNDWRIIKERCKDDIIVYRGGADFYEKLNINSSEIKSEEYLSEFIEQYNSKLEIDESKHEELMKHINDVREREVKERAMENYSLEQIIKASLGQVVEERKVIIDKIDSSIDKLNRIKDKVQIDCNSNGDISNALRGVADMIDSLDEIKRDVKEIESLTDKINKKIK